MVVVTAFITEDTLGLDYLHYLHRERDGIYAGEYVVTRERRREITVGWLITR